MLNIYAPFVVSVAVPIINIHESRAVTLYLTKHRILKRGGFINIKSLHVMHFIDHLINHLAYELGMSFSVSFIASAFTMKF